MAKKKREPKDIEVLFLPVGKPAEKRTIKNNLEGGYTLIAGHRVLLETLTIAPNLCFFFDEEGKFKKDLKPNLDISGDVILGNVFMGRIDRWGNWASVTKKDLALYERLWAQRRLMAPSEDENKKTIERWFSDGDTWVGVFENKDLSHPDIGRRCAVPYDISSWSAAVVGQTRASEFIRRMGMIPWQYILVEKCKTVDEVINSLKEEVRPADGQNNH